MIRAVVTGDMRPRDRAALCRISAMVSDNLLTFFASTGARDEIDRVIAAGRRHHPRECAALAILRAAPAAWLDAEPRATAAEETICHSLVG